MDERSIKIVKIQAKDLKPGDVFKYVGEKRSYWVKAEKTSPPRSGEVQIKAEDWQGWIYLSSYLPVEIQVHEIEPV